MLQEDTKKVVCVPLSFAQIGSQILQNLFHDTTKGIKNKKSIEFNQSQNPLYLFLIIKNNK